MKMILAASALALSFGFATAPSMAADAATCQANWTKLDAKKAGFVLTTEAKTEAAAMTKAGKKTAAADRISDKEYTEACLADVFKAN